GLAELLHLAVAADDLLVLLLDLGQHGPGLGQLVAVGRGGRLPGRARVALEVDRVEQQQVAGGEPDEPEPVDGAEGVGQRLGEVLAAVEVGDVGAAPEVPDEVDPAPGAVDEDQAGARSGGLAGQGGHGPVGEVPAAVRVESPEHGERAVEGDRDRLSPVAVGQLFETHVCLNIGRSVGSLQCTSHPQRGRRRAGAKRWSSPARCRPRRWPEPAWRCWWRGPTPPPWEPPWPPSGPPGPPPPAGWATRPTRRRGRWRPSCSRAPRSRSARPPPGRPARVPERFTPSFREVERFTPPLRGVICSGSRLLAPGAGVPPSGAGAGGAGAEEVEPVVADGEAVPADDRAHGVVDGPLEVGEPRALEVLHRAALHADEVMVVLGQLLDELEAGEPLLELQLHQDV